MKNTSRVALAAIGLAVVLMGCASMGRGRGPVESFVIPAAANPGLPADIVGRVTPGGEPREVLLVVPPGMNLHALVAKFSLNAEATITVISSGSRVVQQNGVTPNDFTTPVLYSVEVAGEKDPWHYRVTVSDASGRPLSGRETTHYAYGGVVVGTEHPENVKFSGEPRLALLSPKYDATGLSDMPTPPKIP